MHQPTTQTLSRIFEKAQEEARNLNQEFVGTEHLALALLQDDDSEAGKILLQMNVQAGFIRNGLTHTLPAGSESPIITGNLPMSPKAQRLVTNALVSAQAAGLERLSSRLLLASLLTDGSGVVCESFRRAGADMHELTRALREKEVTPEP